MPVEWNEISSKSNGGTELMARQLEKRLPADLLKEFQIIPSRPRELDPSKIRILWLHDLPQDPESARVLADGGWSKFHRIVCVSNWQLQRYIDAFGIPWSRTAVLQNAIVPIGQHEKPTDKVRIIYHSTPQRGLNILQAVFDKLSQQVEDVELEVFSSFGLYGWDQRDEEFKQVFEKLQANPKVVLHKAVPNDEVREAIKRSHVFAYPSIWPETSCLCLMEAMSGGLVCVHSNYAALYETASNWTMMYGHQEDLSAHAAVLMNSLVAAVKMVQNMPDGLRASLSSQRSYADYYYNWDRRAVEWEGFLRSLLPLPREIQDRPPITHFNYRA